MHGMAVNFDLPWSQWSQWSEIYEEAVQCRSVLLYFKEAKNQWRHFNKLLLYDVTPPPPAPPEKVMVH